MRHGKASEREAFDGPDEERPLTPKGITRVAKVAEAIARRCKPDRIITSDFRRALETAKICQDRIAALTGLSLTVRVLKAEENVLRPECHPVRCLEFLNAAIDVEQGKVLLFVGHEPNLSGVIALMTGGHGKIQKFKKAGIAVLERGSLNCNWRLTSYKSPRDWR